MEYHITEEEQNGLFSVKKKSVWYLEFCFQFLNIVKLSGLRCVMDLKLSV